MFCTYLRHISYFKYAVYISVFFRISITTLHLNASKLDLSGLLGNLQSTHWL